MRRALAVVALVAACSHGGAPRTPTPRCPSTPVVASSQADLDALAGCARLPGLTVRGGGDYALAPLAELAQVDGDLVVGPTLALGSVGLPALTTVGGRFAVVSSAAVTGVFAPALTAVGSLEVRDNASLVTLSLPRLARVEAAWTLLRVPLVEMVDASAVIHVGGAVVTSVSPTATWLGTPPTVTP